MEKGTKKYFKRMGLITFILICVAVLTIPSITIAASSKTIEKFDVSSNVTYEQKSVFNGKHRNSIRIAKINVADPDTYVAVGYPHNFKKLLRTTTQALNHHKDKNYVVGAINGSFYQFGKPMNLVAENQRLVNAGFVYKGKHNYVNEPLAFGVDGKGKGIIDHYNLSMQFNHKGNTYTITTNNQQRIPGSLVLYTSNFYSKYTETNHYGTEVVVETSKKPTLKFGSKVTGTVKKIRPYGDKTKTAIPKNGFVLSGNGKGLEALKGIQKGDSITLSIDINNQWKKANFILASGPMLVNNGKVNLTIDPNSSRAREVAPRSAVAIDKTGKKVYFITVDGRQGNYSRGMSLPQFARYLQGLGVDRALNLDGGGSTTMAIRYPGKQKVQLANRPSDGTERAVSTMLMAITTNPEDAINYLDVKKGDSHYRGIRWLTGKGITGYSNGKFGSSKSLTRPHASIMFSRALALNLIPKEKVTDYFKDVTPDHPYANFIATTAKEGVFKGSNGEFLPNKSLTREQMASALVNAFQLSSNSDKTLKVKLDNVSKTHQKSVQILANLGITNQLNDFRPKEIVTRGQFATFLHEAVKIIQAQK